ncbi:MAG: histidine kinase [Bdellovibrionales bacterium]|jgi:cell division protein FtsL|nr:histidine kinase [Bdellovibrionales bacterium]
MNSKKYSHLKPFLSLSFIILSLFLVVFFQMEERRIGYSVLKLSAAHKAVIELRRNREIQLARLTRPQRLDQMAQAKLTLKRTQASQIVYLPGLVL